MAVHGEMFIGGRAVTGSNGAVSAISTATGEALAPVFGGASSVDLERACALAENAFDDFRETAPEARAGLLEAIAANMEQLGDELIDRCVAETGLSPQRLGTERTRTLWQLRMFADVVRRGDYVGARLDPAQADRVPPRVDLRLRHIPLGPVAVFGASNFPLAFSVAGGDTAAALAAGAPVIAKSHPAHPGTSELVGRAVNDAVRDSGMPPGTFSMLFDTGYDVGQALVADPRIRAVAFTGSRRGGLALIDIARRRAVPIPVYAEMSSINPVVLFPAALEQRAELIADQFIASLTLGAGQFCTNAGLIIAIDGPALNHFLVACAALLATTPAATMLTPGIHQAYEAAIEQIEAHPAVETIARGLEGHFFQGQAGLFSTTPDSFLAYKELQAEIFGAAALVVRCENEQQLRRVVESLEGQLTASMHIAPEDHGMAAGYLPLLERKVGRIVVNGFATGVEVGHAMVHGGPYPSTADGRSTSVGSLAIERFLRPVSYQDMPNDLLPIALRDANPLHLNRIIDGCYER